MFPSCLESQGCHLIPLSHLLFFLPSPLALSVLSFFSSVIVLMVHSPDFFQKTLKYFSFKVSLFCMAPTEQPGDDSW